MINAIIRWSAQRRGLVVGLVLALALWGAWTLPRIPLDAFPDLGETQVIIYSRWDRSPDLIEDQVTYPIVTAMRGAPGVKTVRGISDFGYSFVYVIFEDGTDRDWARARGQELLSTIAPGLPAGVRTELGPDATGLGWVYQYALVDDSGQHTPAELRSLQDFSLRYRLRTVPGVAEVASVGGFVPQYQVVVDPARLRALGIPLTTVVDAIRRSNVETTGRVIEFGDAEYMIRGRGYVKSLADLEEAVVTGGTPSPVVRIKDVATVSLGPDMRRGAADLDGAGETVSGIVVMRQGANVLDVTTGVKAALAQARPSLPRGVRVVPVYDRSELVERVIRNLWRTIAEITIAVVLVILLFLLDLPSAAIPIVSIPLTVLIVAVPFHLLGFSFNVMSLGGLAIALGALVDASIVVVEQTHKKLEGCAADADRGVMTEAIVEAVTEVGRPAFFALVIMAVAFLPVLALEGTQGRLFHPLAYAKSLTMVVAALLAITLDPALRLTFADLAARRRAGRPQARPIRSEEAHPLSRWLIQIYQPVLLWSLRHKGLVAATVLGAALVTVPAWQRLRSEVMPPLDEGVLLYMPSTVPGLSIGEATRVLQRVDAILREQPEVERVLGKAGRADTATDPAPLSMLETIVVLKPRDQWPQPLSTDALIARLDAAARVPGVANAWSMPIRGRIDMLATGIRSPLGVKVAGPAFATVQTVAQQVEELLRGVDGTRSVLAERANEGRYIDIDWRRDDLARAGLSIDEAQASVEHAIGGANITTIVDGRARYPVNIRLPRDGRSDLDGLREVLVGGAAGGEPVPLGELADVRVVNGPAMIRDEDGLLTGYVFLELDGRDPVDYVADATRLLGDRLALPSGYTLTWSGQYEAAQRVHERLWQLVPLTLLLITVLLYANTRSLAKTGLVLLAVPFSAIGAVWSLVLLGYPVSPAVWVGLIALLGVDAETGLFMVLYLDLAWQQRIQDGRARTSDDLREAVLSGAARRIRPKVMTVATMLVGLVPVLWASGPGSEVMQRIAAPMVGGLVSSFLMELAVYPLLYETWQGRALRTVQREVESPAAPSRDRILTSA